MSNSRANIAFFGMANKQMERTWRKKKTSRKLFYALCMPKNVREKKRRNERKEWNYNELNEWGPGLTEWGECCGIAKFIENLYNKQKKADTKP